MLKQTAHESGENSPEGKSHSKHTQTERGRLAERGGGHSRSLTKGRFAESVERMKQAAAAASKLKQRRPCGGTGQERRVKHKQQMKWSGGW